MRHHIVRGIACDIVAVDRHAAQAAVAATTVGEGAVLRVTGQVPFQHGAGPVSRGADGEVFNMIREIFCKVTGSAHPLLGEIEVPVGMCVVDFRQRIDGAAVEVERRTVHVFFGFRVVEDRDRVFGFICIMVVNDDFGIDFSLFECRTQMVFNKNCLVFRQHQQARVITGV